MKKLGFGCMRFPLISGLDIDVEQVKKMILKEYLMNNQEDLEQNQKDFKPLNEEEQNIIEKGAEIINSKTTIPCTACRYCVDGCPKKIAIPEYFKLYNERENGMNSNVYYQNIVASGKEKASDCIKCGKCEKVCSQHLQIRKYLEDVKEQFE